MELGLTDLLTFFSTILQTQSLAMDGEAVIFLTLFKKLIYKVDSELMTLIVPAQFIHIYSIDCL